MPLAIERMLREQAFTVMNRLAAMKMAEARDTELALGSDDGLVHISKNAGKSWEPITPEGLPELPIEAALLPKVRECVFD